MVLLFLCHFEMRQFTFQFSSADTVLGVKFLFFSVFKHIADILTKLGGHIGRT